MENRAIENARGWLASVGEMVTDLNLAGIAGDNEAEEAARRAIEESPLSVWVRDGWRSVCDAVAGPDEYEILLSTGGPALRIVGCLGQWCVPDDEPRLQWQDWGTPWTDCALSEAERENVAAYARCFWFGE